MKFGVSLPIGKISPPGEFQSPDAVREIALAVEAAGIDMACTSDHPAPDSGWLHSDPAAHDALDPFTSLAFITAATTRLKVFTNAVVLPFRNPFMTAKSAATLQVMSGHRLIMGVGLGYQQVEFDALGVPFKQRAGLTDEALQVLRLCFKGGPITFQGRHFNAVNVEPRPVPSPPPPIWIGGASDKALERAARYGDGWLPYFSAPTNDAAVMASSVTSGEDFRNKIARIRELREEFGQTGPFDVAAGSPYRPKGMSQEDTDRFVEAIELVKACGGDYIWTPLPAPSRAGYLEHIAWYGEIIRRFS